MEDKIVYSEGEQVAPATVTADEGAAVATAGAVPQKKKRHINQQKLQDNLWGWLFCLPLIIGTVWFVYYAFVLALLLSFTTYTGNDGSLMDAIAHYGDYIHPDGAFYWYEYLFKHSTGTTNFLAAEGVVMNEMGRYLFNTVFYMIGIPIGMVLAVFFAVCMSRDIKGANVFRVLYYIPCVASSIAIVYTFKIMFRPNGVMNALLGLKTFQYPQSGALAGTEGFIWMPDAPQVGASWNDLTGSNATSHFMIDPYWCQGLFSKLIIVVMSVWKGLGGTIILYIAGLSGVNAATKEAASIDGANGWQTFWKVTMPDLYPTIFYNIVTSVIGGLQIYAEPELFTNGKGSVNVSGYVALIYNYGLSGNMVYSQGAAYGMFLAVIIFVLTLFQFWLDRRNNN